jgi:hypothetical protein
MSERTWSGLDPAQADGQACVICTQRFRGSGSVWVPVGHSPTGSQVFACAGACAHTALAPGALQVPTQALIAAGGAFLHALEVAAGGDLRRAWPDDVVIATVNAAAPLIVATELRRQADSLHREAVGGDPKGTAFGRAASVLRRRADQLDPHGAGEQR